MKLTKKLMAIALVVAMAVCMLHIVLHAAVGVYHPVHTAVFAVNTVF